MSASSAEGGEVNYTPILDMVFQLITFFMLVVNFKGASMDLSLKLPVLGSARPLDWQGKNEPLTLNIDSTGIIKAYGQQVELEPFIAKEAAQVKKQMKAAGEKTDGELAVPVVIRADKNITFAQINRIINACRPHGYRKFSLSAMNRPPDKENK